MNINKLWCIVFCVIIYDVTAHRNKTRKRHKKHKIKLSDGKRNNSKPFRRDMNEDPLEKLKKEYGQFMQHGQVESYFEPYWQSGEWVFLRLTTLFGQTPSSTTVQMGYLTTKEFRKWPMAIYRDCNIPCLYIYKQYFGPVCGQRFSSVTWNYEYKAFPDMCALERENCKLPNKRPMWYPTHREKFCDELGTFKMFPTDADLISERKTSWSPYEYLRTESTTLEPIVTRKPSKTTKKT